MPPSPVVSREEWLTARKRLLEREKEFTKRRDELSAERRSLPWVRIDKPYEFDSERGKLSLGDLFGSKSQLMVKHFMFGPEWSTGCIGCSLEIDHYDGVIPHLAQRDVAFVVVSRAPLEKLLAFKKRMGWHIDWVSSFGSDFNYDFHVSFTPEEVARGTGCYNYVTRPIIDELSGRSVFYKDEDGAIYHTYSSFGRGGEDMLGIYRLLDIVPKGRDEGPGGNLSHWVKHHDRYER
ncbi:MAG TPA: thioredoxin family protein [Stellaceae bacterium]|jgi:predicted dithiol-disulfide oxidoreductase (DUF899 family)